ncbi:hypothetical protein FA13DRAFT_1625246, partial [Coprinellus micaceus]
NFVEKLKRHLLPRVLDQLGVKPNALPEENWINVSLTRLYAHQLMRLDYTTYNVRRDQDVIHVETPRSNIMFLNQLAFPKSPDEPHDSPLPHPYLYAKVIGIYHANVAYIGALPDGTRDFATHRIDFVWMHRYSILESDTEFSLDRLALKTLALDDALGFLDPSKIVRGVHLIPQFSLGKETSALPRSKYVPAQDAWSAYYINK